MGVIVILRVIGCLLAVVDYTPRNVNLVNFKQRSDEVDGYDTLLSVLDAIDDVFVVLKSIEDVGGHNHEVRLLACAVCHVKHYVVYNVYRVRSRVRPLLKLCAAGCTSSTSHILTPYARLEEGIYEVHFAVQQHLVGKPVYCITLNVERCIIVDALFLRDVIMVGVLTAVVRVLSSNIEVTTCRLSAAASFLYFISEHILLRILEVDVRALLYRDDRENLICDKRIGTLLICYRYVCERPVNMTEVC